MLISTNRPASFKYIFSIYNLSGIIHSDFLIIHFLIFFRMLLRAQIAVFKLPIENENLQQCADSVMRVYAEYYWNTKQYDKIQFHLSDGFG